MNFKVVYKFKDLQTGHIYNVGDSFPHDGRKVKKARLEELASDQNKLRKVLIVDIEDNLLNTNETVKNETDSQEVKNDQVNSVESTEPLKTEDVNQSEPKQETEPLKNDEVVDQTNKTTHTEE